MNDIVPVPATPRAPPATLVAKRVSRAVRTRVARGVSARPRKQTNLKLWLPITPIAVALSPFALLVVPVLAVADAARRTKTAAMLVNGARVFLAMSGTEIVVKSRKADIHIRIF